LLLLVDVLLDLFDRFFRLRDRNLDAAIRTSDAAAGVFGPNFEIFAAAGAGKFKIHRAATPQA
jgi:hypothetical protein